MNPIEPSLADISPKSDVLGHTVELAYRAAFPLLGVPLQIRSNSSKLIGLAEEAFGDWCNIAPSLIASAAPVIVTVVVHPVRTEVQDRAPGRFVHRMHGQCFLASDGVNLLTAQCDRGRALAFVSPELLGFETELRRNVLELLSLLLVTQHDRVPLHSGAVVHNGVAILLAGHSTAGKSTLCYACLRDGFQLLAEDVVYVSCNPVVRLWGLSGQVHLLPDAVDFFPELRDVAPAYQPNGKFKLAVNTARFGSNRAVHHASRAVVCLVDRHAGEDTFLDPIASEHAVAVLSANREPGFDLYEDTEAVAKTLTNTGAFRLTVGSDLTRATAELRKLADAWAI